MIYFHYIVIWFLFLSLICFGSEDQCSIPDKITSHLDSTYTNWRVSQADSEVLDHFKKKEIQHKPNLVCGDFDGNSILDYALQITVYDSVSDDIDGIIYKSQNLLVFFADGASYNCIEIYNRERIYGDKFLLLYKKGEIKPAELGNDEVSFLKDAFSWKCLKGICEEIYIYNDGEFTKIQYADI